MNEERKASRARITVPALAASLIGFFSGNASAAGWEPRPSPTTAALYAVAFSDPNTCVAVGAGGTIVRSIDAGLHWSAVPGPVGDDLRGIAFDGNVGIAVGVAGRLLRSTDGGASWVQEARPTHKILFAAAMNASFAVVTGEEGGIFVSTDGGLTWTQKFAGTASILFGVSVSGNSGVAVGGQGAVVMTTDRGTGWGLTVIGSPLTFFYGTSLATSTTGWLVGSDATSGSVIARTDNGGFTWSGERSPTRNQLFGVDFSDTSFGTAVGDAGTILRTTDGGRLWAPQSSSVGVTLNAVAFSGPDLGIVVGGGGTILRTTNGGAAAGAPPVADGKFAGSAATFARNPAVAGRIDVHYDATTCSGERAVILEGALGDFTSYRGCALADAGNTGTATVDAGAVGNAWFDIVWANGTVGGHPGYGYDGSTDVERTWNAAGFCGLTGDDHSEKTCP